MDTRVMIVLSTAAVLLVAAPAGANPVPLPDPTLIPHYAPEIDFSIDPPEGGWCQAYDEHPVTSAEDLHLRIDVEGYLEVVWYVLAGMCGSDPWCEMEFGLGSYDAAAFAAYSAGPCFPSQGIESAGQGWPGPGTGTSLATTDVPWEGIWVPVYYFTGYAYSAPGPTIIPLGENPSSGNIGYLRCTNPEEEQPFYHPGSLGINMDGTAIPPMQFRACCLEDWCETLPDDNCELLGGVWLEDQMDCDPDPCRISACCVDEVCTLRSELECLEAGGHWVEQDSAACEPDNPCDKGACCLPAGCEYVWEDSCHALHPEITGEFVPGEIWHPSGDCDPGTTWCYPSPILETSWGSIKALYRMR